MGSLYREIKSPLHHLLPFLLIDFPEKKLSPVPAHITAVRFQTFTVDKNNHLGVTMMTERMIMRKSWNHCYGAICTDAQRDNRLRLINQSLIEQRHCC